ncbi:DHA2 family efflux MFS transporter permease subunit [Streptomyces sp. AA8]|nr:DHA2 family efflux MFS transporter permease subunit [Streptomyces telluris]
MGLACTGSFVVILDATIVSVTLPAIRTALGFSPAALPWVVNAYTLAFAGFLLLGGRCADVFGHRATLLTGAALFTAGMVACGFAVTAEALLAARAVQGLGGALLMPVTLSLLTTTFTEPDRRARVLSLWSAVGAAGAASGPVVGGVLIQWAGWRWVFFVTVPIGVLCLVGAARGLPRHDRSGRPPLDVVGAGLATAGLTGVVYAVMRAAVAGWTSPQATGPMAGGVVLLGILVLHQARWARQPLLALDLFRLRAVSSGNVVMLLLGLGFFASPILLSLYLQDVHGWSPLRAGLGYLPVGAAMFAGARAAGALTLRFGPRRTAVVCCLLGAAGFAGVAASLGADGSSCLLTVVVSGVVFGFGTAAAFTPITVAATGGVPPARSGLAAGVLNTVRQTSGAVGLAVTSTVSATTADAWAAAHPGRGGAHGAAALAHGYGVAFLVCAGCVAAAALVAALAMPRSGSV